MYKTLASTLAASLLLAGCASTAPSSRTEVPAAEPVVQADAPQIVETGEFIAFLDALQADIENGEPRELTTLEKRRVEELAGELRGMLDGIDSVEQLNNVQQTRVYNKTQELWTAVIGRDEDQVICRREHRVGTNFKATRCRTVEQIREDQRHAQRYLQQSQGPGPMPVVQ